MRLLSQERRRERFAFSGEACGTGMSGLTVRATCFVSRSTSSTAACCVPPTAPTLPDLMKSTLDRRHLLAAGLCLPWRVAQSQPAADIDEMLRAGGVVIAFRHASAPGTFDPPGFALGDCSTQRNLDDEGRAQARRIGQWFQARRLRPARVRSSPWCRCIDTATLAFGGAEPWPALGSPGELERALRPQHIDALQQALRAVPRGRFEAWVTHQFVLQDLASTPTASAEALVLRGDRDAVQLLARARLY